MSREYESDGLEYVRDYERRLGCEERYLTGATGKEPLAKVTCARCAGCGVEGPSIGDLCDDCGAVGTVAPPCTSLEGAALMATRSELEEVRERLDGPSRVRSLGHNTPTIEPAHRADCGCRACSGSY